MTTPTDPAQGPALPLISTRLNSFALGGGLAHPTTKPPVLELIAQAGRVGGLDALELNYPEHFLHDDTTTVVEATTSAGLAITGIQLRWPAPQFARGGFTATDPGLRQRAVEIACEAVDVCRQVGADHVVLWPAHDGYEYPFQMDYGRSWHDALECYTRVAEYAGDLAVSIEYKPAEPRARTLLSTTGSVLALIAASGRANLHATLDFAHLLMAGENPAQSIALCLNQGRLRGLQMNDGYAKADDGLMVAAVHPVETLEAFFYLVRDGYTGTIYFDTDPVREDPTRECQENVRRTRDLWAMAASMVSEGRVPTADGVTSSAEAWKALVGRRGM